MAYIELGEIKQHLGIVGAEDDGYLTALIGAAQQALETVYGRRFEALAETRLYGRAAVLEGRLHLDGELLSVTTLMNGDGQVLSSMQYRLWPYSARPASRIELRQGASWSFGEDGLISVAGMWGYSATPPAAVVQAMRELVSDFYHVEDRRTAALTKGAAAYRNVDQLPQRVQQLMRGYGRVGL